MREIYQRKKVGDRVRIRVEVPMNWAQEFREAFNGQVGTVAQLSNAMGGLTYLVRFDKPIHVGRPKGWQADFDEFWFNVGDVHGGG